MARGGRRQPASPAPVSGPGRLSARTDGGAGSGTQPIREVPAESHGDRQALTQQQQSAPMPVHERAAQGGRPSGPIPAMDPFAPTQRPGEPATAGADAGPGPGDGHFVAPSPDEAVLALAEAFPHEDMLPLVDQVQTRMAARTASSGPPQGRGMPDEFDIPEVPDPRADSVLGRPPPRQRAAFPDGMGRRPRDAPPMPRAGTSAPPEPLPQQGEQGLPVEEPEPPTEGGGGDAG